MYIKLYFLPLSPSPAPSVTWSGPDGSQINSPSISSVGTNDAGKYTCTVSGQGYSAYLTVVGEERCC